MTFTFGNAFAVSYKFWHVVYSFICCIFIFVCCKILFYFLFQLFLSRLSGQAGCGAALNSGCGYKLPPPPAGVEREKPQTASQVFSVSLPGQVGQELYSEVGRAIN